MSPSILLKDYWQLCKPKIVALIVLTAIIGMLLSSPTIWVDVTVLVLGSVGIALSAASAAILNHIIDKNIDKKMQRTKRRPVAGGRVTDTSALLFSAIIGTMGFTILYLFVNSFAAWLTLLALVGYGVVYTFFLKRATAQNIVIGGLSGAAPPLLGWVAVTGSIDPGALLLVLIVFLWTPPHFWALAVHKYDDYLQSGLPMLPVTHGIECTRLHIVLYSLLMVIACYFLYLIGLSGLVYVFGVSVLNARFLYFVYRLYGNQPMAYKQLFDYSISYLLWLFCLLLVDKIVTIYIYA